VRAPIGTIRAAALGVLVPALLLTSACGGLQPVDPAQALRDGGASMTKLKTVNASLKFTKGTVSIEGYGLVSANAAVRLPSDSDTTYKVRKEDVQISLEVIITGGRVFLHPPFSGFTELQGADAATFPDMARLFDPAAGLPAVIPAGRDPKYLGAERVGDTDCHKVEAVYSAAQIKGMLPQLASSADVDATIWIGGDDHLIRKEILSGKFGDNGTDSTVEVDLSGFNGGVRIASPAVTPSA
jgi:hypothetical protein